MPASIDVFIDTLRSSLLGDNFAVESLSWSPGFQLATADAAMLCRESAGRASAAGWPETVAASVGTAYADRFASGLLASRAFALNLFRMDEDNWFSFDAAVKACSWFEEPVKLASRRELHLFKGVSVKPLMQGRIVSPDLPLVADCGENTLSLIVIGLAD